MSGETKANRVWENRDLMAQWQQSLQRIEEKGAHVFTELFAYQEPQQGPLKGAIISIKDLFDVEGYKTQAGSIFLDDQKAQQDAVAVAKLRAAGASFIGHTNMTELAYSGLGLNPHYGTPDNPIISGRIPGGSTSGGAVSVALGIADATLGTDTGGSLRIPAAFCGLTGFKPSQQSVSRDGCLPLSDSLDSVGPMAKDVATCKRLWQILSDNQAATSDSASFALVVPSNFGMDQLDPLVAAGFNRLLTKLEQAGINIEHRSVDVLESYKTLPIWQFSACESQAYYGRRYALDKVNMDPRVSSRIARANSIDQEGFKTTQQARQTFIDAIQTQEANTIFLLPTVAICAPKFSDLEQNAEYDRINLLCLRNTTLANVMNGCSVSLPFQFDGEPMGLMLTANNGQDQALLNLAKRVEPLLTKDD